MNDIEARHQRMVAEQFDSSVAKHEMTVLLDDGFYRHLRFRSPRNEIGWFELVTWPGSLALRGDVEGRVFSAAADMFDLFRRSSSEGINPGYWAEKVTGGTKGLTSYDREVLEARLRAETVDAIKSRSAPRGLGKAVTEELLRNPDLDFEESARRAVTYFEHGAYFKASCLCGDASEHAVAADAVRWCLSHRRGFDRVPHKADWERVYGWQFTDVCEWRLRTWTWSYLWCCHAVVWGIARYDAAKAAASAETAVA